MNTSAVELVCVEDPPTRDAARNLIAEYLRWIADSAAASSGSVAGFVEINPYAENSSMKAYQPAETMDTYRSSAVFMELRL